MGSVYQKPGRKTWYMHIRDGTGRFRDLATKARTKTAAKEIAQEYEARAKRQLLGLEPRPTDSSMTLAELCEWWLKERCKPASVRRERSRLTHHVIKTEFGRLPLAQVTTARVEQRLRAMELAGSSPGSVNHLRGKLRTVFAKACKAGLFAGQNPVVDTEPRKVPKRIAPTLLAEQVSIVLSEVPEQWRAFFATAVFTGMRKGELCGLRNADVDLVDRTITVRRSYARDTTKGGHADVIPIAPALLAHLAAAIKASRSELVFPASDGSMLSEDANTERVLRSALARAGLVTGYDHICRRCKAKGTPYVERHADATLRHCPRCQMKLWPRPLKSKMRFHDLRHTAATIMLRAGVDPHRVQRVVRHASVTTTTGTYAHLAIEDLRDAVSKIGPQPSEPSPVADRLRTSVGTAPAVNEDTCPKVPENAGLDGAPGRSRTCGPRLRRPLLYPAELQARGPASAFTPRTRQASGGVQPPRIGPAEGARLVWSAPARTAQKNKHIDCGGRPPEVTTPPQSFLDARQGAI